MCAALDYRARRGVLYYRQNCVKHLWAACLAWPLRIMRFCTPLGWIIGGKTASTTAAMVWGCGIKPDWAQFGLTWHIQQIGQLHCALLLCILVWGKRFDEKLCHLDRPVFCAAAVSTAGVGAKCLGY